MNRYFHICILCSLTFLAAACSTTPPPPDENKTRNSKEMHVWSPPDEYELAKRRKRQKVLDDISHEVTLLNIKQQGLNQQTRTVGLNVQETFQKADSLEADLQAKIQFHKNQQKLVKNTLDQLNISQEILKSRLLTLKAMRSRPGKVFSRNDYTRAIAYLKDGKLKQSMHKFNLALHSNPPVSLKDNIHFGLASVYYKLRKYSDAIKHLEAIRKKYPEGDKWYLSHVMLGIIFNTKGEKSRALYILNQARKKNPPDSIKRTIDLMMDKIQEDNAHVSS